MFNRQFQSSSEDSFSDEYPNNSPPEYRRDSAKVNQTNFNTHQSIQPYSRPQSTSGPFISQNFHSPNPVPSKPFMRAPVKSQNEKVGFYHQSQYFTLQEQKPVQQFSQQFQNTPSTFQGQIRPRSSNSQMRAKMLELQKSKYQNKFVASNIGVLSNPGVMAMSNFSPNFSNLYTGPSISEKKLVAFNPNSPIFQSQPFKKTNQELPVPLKPHRNLIQDDQLEIQVINEVKTTKKSPIEISSLMNEQKLQKKTEIQLVGQDPTNFIQPHLQQQSAKQIFHQPPQSTLQTKPNFSINPLSQQTSKQFQPPIKQTSPQNPPIYQPHPQQTKHQQQQKLPTLILPNPTTKQIINRQLLNKKKFLTSPLPRGLMLECIIKRYKSGFSRLFPKFFLHISNGNTFLLAAKKRPGNKTSNYLITMNQSKFSTKTSDYLGKVRSNFLGTEFHCYDHGLNPKRKASTPSNSRQEISVVLYQQNILGAKAPRKMRVIIPSVNSSNIRYTWKPLKKDQGILSTFKNGNTNNMFCFYNKPPTWNQHVRAFVLNFNGRVDRASVKNFQLIDDRDQNKIYLQFGRAGEDIFIMDFQWPFSPLQAFSVALSSFDFKFAFD